MKSSKLALSTLLIANILTILLFVLSDGSIMQALWIYWVQSVIIGIICIFRILILPLDESFLNTNSPRMANTPFVAILIRFAVSIFFILHYGIFHAVYFLFLSSTTAGTLSSLDAGGSASISIAAIVISSIAFAVHHLITFLIEVNTLRTTPDKLPGISTVMNSPYARILPMHLIIIIGPLISGFIGINGIFVLFMFLKTIMDVRLFKLGFSHPKRK